MVLAAGSKPGLPSHVECFLSLSTRSLKWFSCCPHAQTCLAFQADMLDSHYTSFIDFVTQAYTSTRPINLSSLARRKTIQRRVYYLMLWEALVSFNNESHTLCPCDFNWIHHVANIRVSISFPTYYSGLMVLGWRKMAGIRRRRWRNFKSHTFLCWIQTKAEISIHHGGLKGRPMKSVCHICE